MTRTYLVVAENGEEVLIKADNFAVGGTLKFMLDDRVVGIWRGWLSFREVPDDYKPRFA